MSRLVWITLTFWPLLATGQWVQIGFLPSGGGTTQPPGSVVVSSEYGVWQREYALRDRNDVRSECAVTEPILLPKNQLHDGYAVRWEQVGAAHSFSFTHKATQPLQILLEPPPVEMAPQTASQRLEPRLTLAPNPFNPVTSISLELPEAAHLRLEIFDVLGRSVTLLHNAGLSTGTHRWIADGSSWASGAYFLSYRLSSGQSGIRRMQLLK